MPTFIDSYRKPLLAVFGVLLMVVFMLPSSMKYSGGDRANPVIGHIGKNDVHAQESSTAEADWEILTRRVLLHTQNPQQPWVPLPYATGMLDRGAGEIERHKQSFLLLVKEAELHGVTVTNAEIDEVLNSPQVGIREDTKVVAFSDVEDLDKADRYREAVGRLLLVQHDYQAAHDTIKISAPLRQQMIARQFQSVDMAVVDVPASQFTAPAPTTQQVEEQFKKYADVSPEETDKSPNGFGYRFADRVKVQSVEIPEAAVRAAAERARTKDANTQYEWDRDAYRYYMANMSQFAATQPATTAPSTAPAARPFAQVKDEARKAVLDNDVAKMEQRILDRVSNQMTSDYVAYRNALTTGGANAKIPASSVNVPYNSYDYLQKLAAEVQKSFDVLPTVSANDKEYLGGRDLLTLPGLGQTVIDGQSFAAYVMTHAVPFTSEQDDPKALRAFEPSPVVHDDYGNSFIFRISDAQLAHAPKSVAEVQGAVEQDLRAEAVAQQAKKVAEEIVAKAKQSGSLASAANAAGRNVITLTGVRFVDPSALMPLHLASVLGQRDFLRQTFDLMSMGNQKGNGQPMGVIVLPRDGRAMAAQITAVHSDLTAEDLTLVESQAGAEAAREMAMPLMADWFNYDSIVARLHYVATENNNRDKSGAPANPVGGPANQPLL